MEGRSFGTFNQRVGYGGSQENFNYVFNVQHFRSTNTPVTPLNQLAPGERRNNDSYDNWTYSTKLGANVTDTFGVNFVARYTQSVLGFTGETPELLPAGAGGAAERANGQSFLRPRRGRLVAIRRQVQELLWRELYERMEPQRRSESRQLHAPPAVAPPSTNLGQRTQVDWRGEARVIPGQTFVFGLEDKKESLTTRSTGAFNGADLHPFTTMQYRESQRVRTAIPIHEPALLVETSATTIESFGPHTTWRFAPTFIVPVTETKLKFTYGTGFKAPTLTELYVNFPAFNSVGNPNLAPETSSGIRRRLRAAAAAR